jgi:hypothetical protein
MNNQITLSDFTGKWVLPQQGTAYIIPIYEAQIADLQTEFLKELFGYNFYLQLKTAWEASELEENPVALDPIWSKLLNGDDVTVDGIVYRFEGYKQALKMYCYIAIVSDGMVSISTNGLFVAKSENSERIDPTVNLFNRWSEMINYLFKDSIIIYDYIDDKATYPSYTITTKLVYESWL